MKTCYSPLFMMLLTLSLLSMIRSPAATNSGSRDSAGFQTLFFDDFSAGLGKWNIVRGNWSTNNGYLTATSDNAPSIISAGDPSWSDYILTVQARSISGATVVAYLRWVDMQNHYRIVLSGDHLEFWLRRGGSDVLLYQEGSGSYGLNLNAWHEIKLKIYANVPTIAAYIDGSPEITVKDLSHKSISSGMIALGVDGNSSSAFDNASITTLHPDAYGPHSIIILLVEFPDVKHTLTSSQIRDSVFGTLNQYYTEVSYNLTWITGQVTPTWKMLPQPATYYDLPTVTSSGWGKGRDVEIVRDAITLWDSEIDFRQYDSVLIVTAANATWSYEESGLSIATGDNIALNGAVVLGRIGEGGGWETAAHELGHVFGLPDLYSYPIAYSGPADWREAAVYVGPWDLMSRSDERPHIGAWGKIKLGWLAPDRVFELLPGQQGATSLDPLEIPDSGIQAIEIYLTSTTYFIIENREPIGFDSVLPDKGVLISYVDESKYWHGTGPVVVQDANPGTAPRWQLLHPTFTTDSGGKSLFTNQTYNVATLLLEKLNDSYLVTSGTPDNVNIAKAQYTKAKDLIQEAQTSLKETGSYRSQDAIATVQQAMKQYELAREALLTKTFEPFKASVSLANQTLALLDRAKQIEQQYEASGHPEQNPPVWITAAAGTVIAMGIIAVVWLVRRKMKTRTNSSA